jgi:hypothetical protein
MCEHEEPEDTLGKKVEIFAQGEGFADIRVLEISPVTTVAELLAELRRGDRAASEEHILFIENDETEHSGEVCLVDIGVGHHSHVHHHRCRKVAVTVNYNGEAKARPFPPSATIENVTRWATREFGLDEAQAAEHALLVCSTGERPDPAVHIGTLVSYPHCQIGFDLVPKVRSQG